MSFSWTVAAALGCTASLVVGSALPARSQTAAGTDGDARGLVFDPAVGARIGKMIRVEHSLETIAIGVSAGADEWKELPRFKLMATETLSVDDEYVACANGRPVSLRRIYREIVHDFRAFAPGKSEPATHLTATSPFTGLSVLFTWVPEDREYGRLFDAREGVEESLASLSEDLDLRELLPPRDMRIGEKWDIEPTRLRELLAAGGKVPLSWTPESDDPMLRHLATGVGGALYEVWGDTVRGRVAAEFSAVTRAGDDELAQVGIAIELDTTRDQTELLRNRMTRAEVLSGSIVTRGQIAFRLNARATLSWNLTQRRVEAFELEGIQEIEREIDVGGGQANGGRTEKASLKGPLKLTLTVGPARAIEAPAAGGSVPPEPEPDGGDTGGGD